MWVSSVQAWLVLDVFAVIGVSAFFPPKFSQRGIFRFAERNLATPQVKPFPKVLQKDTGDSKSAHPTPDDHCEPRIGIRRLHYQVRPTPDSKITKSAHSTSSKGIHGVEKERNSQREVAPKASFTTIHDKEKQVLSVKHLPGKGGSKFPGEENRKRSIHDIGDKAGPKIESVPPSHSASITLAKVDDNLKKTDLETNEVLCKIRSGRGVTFHGSFEQLHQPRINKKPYFAHGTCTSSKGSQEDVKKRTHVAASSSSKGIHGVKEGEHIGTSISSAKADLKVPGVGKRTHYSHDTKSKTDSEVKSLKANAQVTAKETKLTYRPKKTGQSARNGGVKSTPEAGKQPHPAQQAIGQASSKVTNSLKKTALAHVPAVKLQPKGIFPQIHDSRHVVPQLAETASKAINSLKETGQLALDTEAKSNPKQTGSVKEQQHPEYHDTLSKGASKSTDSLKINARATRGPAAKPQTKNLPRQTKNLNHNGAAKIVSKVPDNLTRDTQLAHDTGSKSNLKLNPSVQKQHPEYHSTINNSGSKTTDNAQASHRPAAKSHQKDLPKQTVDFKHDGAAKIASKLTDSLKKAPQLAHHTGAKSNPKLTPSVKKQQHPKYQNTMNNARSKPSNSLKNNAQESLGPAAKFHSKGLSKQTQDSKQDDAAKISSKLMDSLKKAAQIAHDTGAKSNPKLTPSVKKQQHPKYQNTMNNARSKPSNSLKNNAQESLGPAAKFHFKGLSKQTQDSKQDDAAKISSKLTDSLKKATQSAHDTGAKSNPKLTPSVTKQQHPKYQNTMNNARSKPSNRLKNNAQGSLGPAAKFHFKGLSKQTQDSKQDDAAKISSKLTDSLKKAAQIAHDAGAKSDPRFTSSVKKQQHSEHHDTPSKVGSKATNDLKNTVPAHGPAVKPHPKERFLRNQDLKHDATAKIASKLTDSLKKASQSAHDTGAKSNPKLTLSVKKQQHPEYQNTMNNARSKPSNSLKTNAQASHGPATKSHSKDLPKQTQDFKHDRATKIATELIDSLKKAAQLLHNTGATSNPQFTSSMKKPQHSEHHDTPSKAGFKATNDLKKIVTGHGTAAKSHPEDHLKRNQDLEDDSAAKMAFEATDSLTKAAKSAHNTGTKSNPKVNIGVKNQQHSEQHGNMNKGKSKATGGLKKTVASHGLEAIKSRPEDLAKETEDLKYDSASNIASKVAKTHLPHNTGTNLNPKLISSAKEQQHSVHRDTSKIGSKLTASQEKTASSAKGAASMTDPNSKVHKRKGRHTDVIIGNRMGNWLNSLLW